MQDKEKVYQQFIKENKVLLVDKNPNSRARLFKILAELGSRSTQIYSVSSHKEAVEIIDREPIGMVLSDYFIIGGSGFDLFRYLRSVRKNKLPVNILVTSNVSQSAVARAAEEDVDTFIVKPYTVKSVKQAIVDTVFKALCPSDYMKLIMGAKDLIVAKKYDEAIAVLNKALSLNPRPTLAKFYIGQAEYFKKSLKNAENQYREGLQLEGIHFKCLVGLYELLLEMKKYDDAYSVVRKITRVFPANPDRINEVIHLAVRTGHYLDMQIYYEIFCNLEERNPSTIRHIGAGLVVGAKYLFSIKNHDQAVIFLKNVGVSCSDCTDILRKVINELVLRDEITGAAAMLKRFDPETVDEQDYTVCKFVLDCYGNEPAGPLITHGMKLYEKEKVRDLAFVKSLICLMKKANLPQRKIKEIEEDFQQLKKAV